MTADWGSGVASEAADIVTDRLLLPPLSVDGLQALIDRDRGRLEAATGAAWPQPLEAPPETDDALSFFRDRLRDEPAIAPWWSRLVVRREDGAVVGMAGFGGPPDADGAVTIGYAVYPAFQRRGYATETVRALVAWALAQPRARRVRATISPDNAASLAVAQAAGMRHAGDSVDDEGNAIQLWEIGTDAEPDQV